MPTCRLKALLDCYLKYELKYVLERSDISFRQKILSINPCPCSVPKGKATEEKEKKLYSQWLIQV